MAPLRHAVHILPDVMIPILRNTEDPSDLSPLAAPRPRLVDDLLWWMDALSAARIREGAA